MHPIQRLLKELAALSRTVPPAVLARYTLALIPLLPAVLRERSLTPVDRTVNGTVRFRRNGRDVTVPVGRVTAMLLGHDNTSTFGGLREMYASNVYLRAFRPGIPMETVVDLGANRGLFSLLAVVAHDARIAVGVEPLAWYEPVADVLAAANGIDPGRMPRHRKCVADIDGPDTVTLASLARIHGLEGIDFLKCDIEGAEFSALTGDRGTLEKVRNIGMELHPEVGDAAALARHLEARGFAVRVTDQFGRVRPEGRMHYLYASRGGDLVP